MREDFNYYEQNVNKAEEAGKKFLKLVDNKTCFVKKKTITLILQDNSKSLITVFWLEFLKINKRYE